MTSRPGVSFRWPWHLLAALLGTLVMEGALAAEPMLLAGTIIMAPDKASEASSSAASARDNRARARGYAQDQEPQPVVPESVEEMDDGVLVPRGSAGMPDNRARARAWRKGDGDGKGANLPPEDGDMPWLEPDERQLQLERNRARARAYREGAAGSNGAQKAPDNGEQLPWVVCGDVNNVSGRIGEDTAQGAVVSVMRNGKWIKARCRLPEVRGR